MKVRVGKRHIVATDIVLLELVENQGGQLPPFAAGAHIDVHLPNNIIRQYSLCNRPDDGRSYCIAVLRDPASRGGSTAVHELAEGQFVEISEPKNNFPLHWEAAHSILFAGGIGITPILSMAERLSHAGASFEMHYCTRSTERTAFRERLKMADIRDCVRFYHDEAGDKANFAAILESPRPNVHVYVCGPMGFINAVLDVAKQSGWSDGQLHREYFNATPSGEAHSTAFQITIASSGKVVSVSSEQSVVEALRDHGIEVPVSCEQGVCGTCQTRVLAGEPDHRDLYLTDQEKALNDQMMPCCSRSRSPMLVLDL
jgi:vanillate O-demethylase ferredoxin subunit